MGARQAGVYKFSLEGEWEGIGHHAGLAARGRRHLRCRDGQTQGRAEIKFNLRWNRPSTQHAVSASPHDHGRDGLLRRRDSRAVIDQGYLPVSGGKFEYFFDPSAS